MCLAGLLVNIVLLLPDPDINIIIIGKYTSIYTVHCHGYIRWRGCHHPVAFIALVKMEEGGGGVASKFGFVIPAYNLYAQE